MGILLFCFIVILLLILAIFIIQRMPFGDAMLKWALEAISVFAAIVAIAMKAGIA